MRIGIAQNFSFVATPYQPYIWRALLWHTGKKLPGHTAFKRTPFLIEDITINARIQNKVNSILELRTTDVPGYCNWVQVENFLYIRFRIDEESSSAVVGAVSPEWYLDLKMYSYNIFLTDDDFKPGETSGLLTHYNIKIKADIGDYSALKFNTFSLQIIKEKIEDFKLLYGKIISIYEENTLEEKQFIEKVSADWDTIYLNTKDYRAQYTNMVINQKYNKNDYVNEAGDTVLDGDTQKEYKKDAVGYCIGVPCDCLNGSQYNTYSDQFNSSRRYYRAAYGSISIDKVEYQIENGWKTAASYQIHTLSELSNDGIPITTTIVSIPVLAAHPAIEGTASPDLQASPRKVRITGTFHSERANITRMQSILQYLIERYSLFIYDSKYFNTAEILSELSVFNGYRAGIYIEKPTKLFEIIGKLQNGHIYGWQFYQRKGLLTARVNNPSRTPYPYSITDNEVHNHKSLKIELSTNYYVSKAVINYAKNYGADEDNQNSYFNEKESIKIVMLRGAPQEKSFDLLVDSEEAAKIRYARETAYGLHEVLEIKGIELFGDKWMNIRQYDFVNVNIDNFYVGMSMITNVEIEKRSKKIKVDIISKV